MNSLTINLKQGLPNLGRINPMVINRIKKLLENKHKNTKVFDIFDDEIKVSEIDISKINIKDITIDGYIIDELGNVKRLSDESILFLRKIFKTNTIAINRVKTNKNYLDDIIKVVDIDLSKIDLKNIHKDGYYIDSDGSVKKLSDEAILFLRKIYPTKKIAENRLSDHKSLEEKNITVEDIDLTTIELKNINIDGYYIDKYGTVNRLTDEALIFLRKIYNDNKIAFNRTCHEQKTVTNSIKLETNKKKIAVPSILSVIKGTELISKLSTIIKRDELDQIQKELTKVKIDDFEDKIIKKEDKELLDIKEYLEKVKVEDLTSQTPLERIKNIQINASNKVLEIKGKIADARKPLFAKRIKYDKPERVLIDGIRPDHLQPVYFSDKVEEFKNKLHSKTQPIKKTLKLIKTPAFAKLNKGEKPKRLLIDGIRQKNKITFSEKVSNLKISIVNRIIGKIRLIKTPVFAKRTKGIIKNRVLINSIRPANKIFFKDRINNLKINLSNKLFALKQKIILAKTPVFAKRIKCLKPERVFLNTLRPDYLKKPTLSERLKINYSNMIFNIKNKIELSKTPVFAQKNYIKNTAGLRQFQTGLRPEKNMGELNMLERIKNIISTPSYARKTQVSFAQRSNSNRKFKLVKEPLFKSSRTSTNMTLLKRRLIGIGGAVALSSSMASGLTPNTSANGLSYSIQEETKQENNIIRGTIELKDDFEDNTIQGIVLDLHEREIPLSSFDDLITDIDPLTFSEDEKEDIIETTVNKETTPIIEETTSIVEKTTPVYTNEDYIDYVLNHEPYTEGHMIDIEQTRQIIEKYSKIYNVNSEVVYNKLAELTDNFSSEDYLNSKTITQIKCKNQQVYANSYEELLMLAVRNIAQLPSRFNINYNELHNCEYYVSPTNYAQEISDIAKLFNIDRCLVYAIIHTETNFVSDLFLQRNNPAGLMDNATYCTFSSKEEGFIELCTEIRKYNNRGAYTLEEMAQIHCQGNEKWAPVVREVYNTLKTNEAEIFGDTDLVLTKAR